MNVSLYEISADFLKALDGLEVDEETGEITNFDAVEALNAQFEDKAVCLREGHRRNNRPGPPEADRPPRGNVL